MEAKLVIWDKAPMVHKHCFEALDRTLKDILRKYDPNCANLPFGGKTVVFGGDFRQILPVVQTREPISNYKFINQLFYHMATLQSSKTNREHASLQLCAKPRCKRVENFCGLDSASQSRKWNNRGDNDGKAEIMIPDEFLVKNGTSKPLEAIASTIYPDLLNNITNVEYLEERAILTPTNEIVEEVNNTMLSLLPGEEHVYLSVDSICSVDTQSKHISEEMYSAEYLNSIRSSGLPNHEIRLKVNTPIMLMRNLDTSRGLCNGTRLRVTKLGTHVIEAEIIASYNRGTRVYIPRLTLSPSNIKLPFRLRRRQFPIMVSFAMTINKSQGQSLKHVGLYLPRSVFAHGQLYVCVLRVTNKQGLKFMITDKEGRPQDHTTNVVYKEIFRNL